MQTGPVGEIDQRMLPTPDGTSLCVYRLGSGERTVLIPNAVHVLEHLAWLARNHTVIAWDLRNRGRSATVSDRALLHRGVHHDVEDIETVRAAFKVDRPHLIGHSYLGLAVILYAIAYPDRADRVVQIGPMGPDVRRAWPEHLRADDLEQIASSEEARLLTRLREEGVAETNPEAYEHAFRAFYRHLLVFDPAKANEIGDHLRHLDNERPIHVERHLRQNVMPSIERLGPLDEDLAALPNPVLVIHGRQDRNVAYGAGREWALKIRDARLVTVPEAAHMPFLERPEIVQPAIEYFLAGDWPPGSEQVTEV
jgi:pimeloyl-ACP methyl ester carboxylesterase